MEEKLSIDYSEESRKFQDFIAKDKKLPRNINKLLLFRYLKTCNFDHEKAKELLITNLEFRKNHPHLFNNRDVNSKEMQQVINTFYFFKLQQTSKENCYVTFTHLFDEDSNKFDFVETIKYFLMLSDSFYIHLKEEDVGDGEIGVLDFKGFTWWHFMKIVRHISDLKAFLNYIQETVPYRIVQNHYINCSPILTKIMTLIRPFVKKELFDIMHFHSSGYESLYEFLPKEILPMEYGGYDGTIKDHHKRTTNIVASKNDYLMNEDNWKMLE